MSMVVVQLGAALSTSMFDEVGPAGTAWLRLSAGGLMFLAIARPRLRNYSARQLRTTVVLGLVTAVMTVAFLYAIELLPLGTVVAIEFLGPLGVAAFRAHSRRGLIWPALALVGVLLLTEPWLGETSVLGVALALVAAIGWAAYILLTQTAGDDFNGLEALAIAIPVAALASTVVGLPAAWGNITPSILVQAVWLALLFPVIPVAFELLALRRLTTAAFGTLMALEPAFATAWGAVLLAQIPNALQAAGVVLVIVAGVGAERGGRREPPPAFTPLA